MEKPTIISVTHDDDSHSHWALVDTNTGVKLWSENQEECMAQGYPVEQSHQADVSGSLPLSEMKEAFQAGKYLGFGEAHRRPGNYHSFEEWLKVRGGNDR